MLNTKTKETRNFLQKLFNKSNKESTSYVISNLLNYVKSSIDLNESDKMP